jgi:peptidoglycan/xylan/chitin deacetylase (PgdA/CDA1 family)
VGEVVISIDAELAWGYHDLETVPDRIDDAREGWQATLRLLEKHDVPATWAIVGHLFLDECDGRHAEHPLSPGWFSCVSGPATPDDDWHALDLIGAVQSAEQDHEIGSHNFSHVVMNDGVDRSVADAEIADSVAAARRFGIELESFVYPRNRVAHRDVLAERGFSCYRGPRPRRWYEDTAVRPLMKLADWSPVGFEPPIVTPTIDEHGLVDVPASLYLFSFEGGARRAAKRLGYPPVVSVAKRGIDEAVEADGVFHMWFHPHNLLQPDGTERLDAILEHLDRRRKETDLTVRTMGEVADDVLADRTK